MTIKDVVKFYHYQFGKNALWQKNLILRVCSTKSSLQRIQARMLVNFKYLQIRFYFNELYLVLGSKQNSS